VDLRGKEKEMGPSRIVPYFLFVLFSFSFPKRLNTQKERMSKRERAVAVQRERGSSFFFFCFFFAAWIRDRNGERDRWSPSIELLHREDKKMERILFPCCFGQEKQREKRRELLHFFGAEEIERTSEKKKEICRKKNNRERRRREVRLKGICLSFI
jgi:hypothetical protein